jgi:Zn-dependent protease with chaperone function
MTSFPGCYHDGRSSARTDVTVSCEGDRIMVTGTGIDRVYFTRETRLSSGIGSIRRTLRFPDGSQCEVSGDFPLDSLLAGRMSGRLQRLLRNWERSLPLALLALLLTVGIVTLLVRYGIPAAAKRVAFSLPAETEAALGKEALSFLDRMVFAPSKLPNERQRQIRVLFQEMARDLPGSQSMRIEFRSSEKVGANAFALPSGIIVITDRLVELAQHDEEFTGVLAHEAGHLLKRHALRHVLQNSGTALIIAVITGDITSVTALSAGLPTALVEAKYSRDFEIEADDAAVAYMRKRGIPVHYYADMLKRLEEDHEKKRGAGGKEEKSDKGKKAEKGDKSSMTDYFASHPVTKERIERISKGQQGDGGR